MRYNASMRQIRSFTDDGCYHLTIRVVHKAFFLDDGEAKPDMDFANGVNDYSHVMSASPRSMV